ncbi:MAG: AAA family ATPase [Verrucomicrobiales bacterium]|nr:AAA family ATPase [Verrucomicrobiales bacterium]MCP5525614.1 AAA family ATPase [Verrucomicrobiales bacterium]
MSTKPETEPAAAPILRSASIKKFGLFTDETLEFSSGLNVFIGRNGCGKSHLIKLLYTLVKVCGEAPGDGSVLEAEKLENRIAKKLARVFRPQNDHIGRLVQRATGRRGAMVSGEFTNKKRCSFRLSSLDKVSEAKSNVGALQEAAFLPSREVLALFEGFVAAYEKRELSFDETFRDICLALSEKQLRGKRAGMLDALVRPLEDEIRGKVSLEGGRFYVTGADGSIEAHLVSEGWRKLAALAQLIINGTLTKNGFLFWDEPEANLNPKMVVQLSDTLLRLANQGIQVFVVSHDYLLTTRLSLASEYPEAIPEDQRCPVKFFGLVRRGSDGKGVSVSSGSKLADLQDNPILEEYAALYDYEGSLFQKSQPEA